MKTPPRVIRASLLLLVLGAAAPAARTSDSLLLDGDYPLEATAPFSSALFHWVDSLAGTSGGKTISLYQEEFYQRFGRLSREDHMMLGRFRDVRLRHAAAPANGRPHRGTAAMLEAFLEKETTGAAVETLRGEAPAADLEALRLALAHFAPRYEKLWRDGKVPRRFIERARGDSAREELGRLLARIARFLGVDPRSGPRPRLVLVPVPSGGGTHAQAVGRHLLLEIRSWERLADEAGPIVHENAHYLWSRIERSRFAKLAAVAHEIGPRGVEAWDVLREALPTALGQGVAERALLPREWSASRPWYHSPEVDAYAKAIYPWVQEALDHGAVLDEALMKRLLRGYPGTQTAPER